MTGGEAADLTKEAGLNPPQKQTVKIRAENQVQTHCALTKACQKSVSKGQNISSYLGYWSLRPARFGTKRTQTILLSVHKLLLTLRSWLGQLFRVESMIAVGFSPS